MSHVRTQIRNAVAALLSPLGGVHVSRVYPIQEAELPVYLVYTGPERIDGDFQSLNRALEVTIECVAQADALDDALDVALASVEAALGGQTLGGLVLHLLPTSIEILQSAEGSSPIGRARITYEALYRTSFTDPATSI